MVPEPSRQTDRSLALRSVQDRVLHSLRRAEVNRLPFSYWLLDAILPDWVIDDLLALPVTPPDQPIFDGRRESNNSTRVYVTPALQARVPACAALAQAFDGIEVRSALRQTTGRDLSQGLLRIEYCLDVDGFWLEPHLDIAVKLFTMLVYLSDDANLTDAGTDIYDDSPEHRLVARPPYRRNSGLIFLPGEKSWHGFAKRPIRGLRRSLIINFVAPEWRNREELA